MGEGRVGRFNAVNDRFYSRKEDLYVLLLRKWEDERKKAGAPVRKVASSEATYYVLRRVELWGELGRVLVNGFGKAAQNP